MSDDIVIKNNAVLEEEFHVYFQPKIDLNTGKVSSAEALSRLVLPNGDITMPDHYIPVFEKNGLIKAFDFFIFEKVCNFLSRWNSIFHNQVAQIPISVNFSRIHFLESSFLPTLETIMKRYNISPQLIELEITETSTVQNVSEFNSVINDLHKAGFTCALDDFGAHQSSLGMLKDLDIDVLKIDRSFLTRCDSNRKKLVILKMIIELAKQLEITSVAEGAETQNQVDCLKKFGCDQIQGWYYSRALPEKLFTEYLLKENGKLVG